MYGVCHVASRGQLVFGRWPHRRGSASLADLLRVHHLLRKCGIVVQITGLWLHLNYLVQYWILLFLILNYSPRDQVLLPRCRYLWIRARNVLSFFGTINSFLHLPTAILVFQEPRHLSLLRKRLALHAIELIFLLISTVLRLICIELLRNCLVEVHFCAGIVGEGGDGLCGGVLPDWVVVAGEWGELLVFASVSLHFWLFASCDIHFTNSNWDIIPII